MGGGGISLPEILKKCKKNVKIRPKFFKMKIRPKIGTTVEIPLKLMIPPRICFSKNRRPILNEADSKSDASKE